MLKPIGLNNFIESTKYMWAIDGISKCIWHIGRLTFISDIFNKKTNSLDWVFGSISPLTMKSHKCHDMNYKHIMTNIAHFYTVHCKLYPAKIHLIRIKILFVIKLQYKLSATCQKSLTATLYNLLIIVSYRKINLKHYFLTIYKRYVKWISFSNRLFT